jgi:DNA polymerase-3 subunit gamma/tau
VALAQFAPAAITEDDDRLLVQAQRFDAEFLQLAYQIAIHGRDELPLAPDEATGFTMCLLRLLAFRPEQPGSSGSTPPSSPGNAGKARPLPSEQPKRGGERFFAPTSTSPSPPCRGEKSFAPAAAPQTAVIKEDKNAAISEALARKDLREVVRALGLTGMMRELLQHCEWADCNEDRLNLRLSETHRHLLDLNDRTMLTRIESELVRALVRPLRLNVEIGSIAGQTPAQRDELERRERHAQAVSALETDPFVRGLIERCDASLNENTVKPL